MKALRPTERGALGTKVQTFEVRFSNQNGDTESWQVAIGNNPVDRWLETRLMALGFRIESAALDDTVDIRLASQADSIGRLLQHVGFHHDELRQRLAEDCTWLKQQWHNMEQGRFEVVNEAAEVASQHHREIETLVKAVMAQTRDEIWSAVAKHGIEKTPLNDDMDPRDVLAILMEELGELAHELTYDAKGSNEERKANAEREAIQVAAMAICYVVGSARRELL